MTKGNEIQAELVLASDVHLQHLADKRARLLIDMLQRLAPSVQYLVLNGDIFDFCFGDSAYYKRKFRALGDALEAVAARGTKVVFIEGNHEVHMQWIGWQHVEFVVAKDYIVTLRSGTRIKITHGDLLTEDPLYRAFRGLIKSDFARRGAHFIPGGWLDAYSLRHAKVSRSQDRYRKLDHAKILGAFDRWLAGSEADHGIIGHFHVPYAEKRPAGHGYMMSVDCWDQPNILLYAQGAFRRALLTEPGRPVETVPAEPLFNAGQEKPV